MSNWQNLLETTQAHHGSGLQGLTAVDSRPGRKSEVWRYWPLHWRGPSSTNRR